MSFRGTWKTAAFGLLVILLIAAATVTVKEIRQAQEEIASLTDMQKKTSERLTKTELEVQKKEQVVDSLKAEVDGLKKDNDGISKELAESKSAIERKDARMKKVEAQLEKAKADAVKARQEAELAKKEAAVRKEQKRVAAENAKKKKVITASAAAPAVKTAAVTPSRSAASKGNKSIVVSATAYTAYCAGCSGVTRTGIDLRANPGLKVIAVDPNVIPLGSKVHVEGYGYAVAGDTGGAIKGHKVDLFMADKGNALQWGRKNVKVTILD